MFGKSNKDAMESNVTTHGQFIDYLAVQNTLSLYCVALDTKDFDLFAEIFTQDADTKYPFAGGDLTGVEAIVKAISKRLEPVTTQHSLTTQNINFWPDGKTASVMTYFTGIHWGKGRWQGEQLIANGKYVDELVRVGAGKWRIRKRETVFMAPPTGERRVMEPS